MLTLDIKLDFKNYQLNTQLEIPESGIVGLYGKSGIGKSTLLKVLSGLQRAKHAFISLDDTVWYDSEAGVFLPPQKRSVGLVFQDFALFPNLTVFENLQFSQRISQVELNELIDTLGIDNILDKQPGRISGGQKQRVAIGRAISYNPSVLLLDEPFAALDEEVKEKIKAFLKEYIDTQNKIAILASHDIQDLQYFTDRIIKISESEPDASTT